MGRRQHPLRSVLIHLACIDPKFYSSSPPQDCLAQGPALRIFPYRPRPILLGRITRKKQQSSEVTPAPGAKTGESAMPCIRRRGARSPLGPTGPAPPQDSRLGVTCTAWMDACASAGWSVASSAPLYFRFDFSPLAKPSAVLRESPLSSPARGRRTAPTDLKLDQNGSAAR